MNKNKEKYKYDLSKVKKSPEKKITNFLKNDYTAIVNDTTKTPNKIAIPAGFETHSFLKLIIAYLKGVFFTTQLQPETRKSQRLDIQRLFLSLNEIEGIRIGDNCNQIPYLFMQKLSNEGLTDWKIYNRLFWLGSLFKWIKFNEEASPYCDSWVYETVANTPELKWQAPQNPTPALTTLFEDELSSDEDYILSCRLTSIAIMEVFQEIRELLCTKSELLKNFIQNKPKDINVYEEPPFAFVRSWWKKKGIKDYRQEWNLYSEFINEIIHVAIRERHPVLIEMLYVQLISNSSELELLSTDFQIEALKKLFDIEGNLIFGSRAIQKNNKQNFPDHPINKQQSTSTFKVISLGDLISPSLSENIAFAWFLASDRIQESPQTKLQLKNFDVNNKRFVIKSFNKKRSKRHFPGKTYHNDKQSNIARVLSKHVQLLEEANSLNLLPKKNHVHIVPAPKTYQGTVKKNKSLGISLLGLPKGEMTREILKRTGKNVFIELIQRINPLLTKRIKLDRKSKKSKKSNDTNEKQQLKNNRDKVKVSQITINMIAQSKAYVDNSSLRKVLGNHEATDNAHSNRTNKTIYKDRARSYKIIADASIFAAQVADLMEQDAKKLNILPRPYLQTVISEQTQIEDLSQEVEIMSQETKIVSINQIRKELDLLSPSQKNTDTLEELKLIEEFAEIHDYTMDIASELSDGKKRIIIESPLTAVLLKSYIEVINKSFREIYINNKNLGLKLLIKKAFFLSVLDEFSNKTLKESELIYIEYMKHIPFPNLI